MGKAVGTGILGRLETGKGYWAGFDQAAVRAIWVAGNGMAGSPC